ncbi:MAG TPA: phosphate ABC transporter permease subunit PstC [Bacteroidales bacterium]
MKLRRKFEKITESILFASSTVTTLTVLLIIIFLFKEGISLFNDKPVEHGYVLSVNKENPVNILSEAQIKDIFDQEITNWKQVGGKDDSIIIFSLNDITNYYTEEELGADLEFMPDKINELIGSHTGIIAYMHSSSLPKNFKGKHIEIKKIGLFDFLGGKEWFPTATPAAQFGALPLILGTLWVSLGAILLALPIGLVTALYLTEVADKRVRDILKPVIELLAGIPSVVYGFFGLVVIVPIIHDVFGLSVGETALAGSIILAIMALPTIITISEDALSSTPRALKEASLALGASRWQTLYRVTIPYSKSGITAAAILGIGRAMGETMAVLMVTGNASVIPHTFLQPVRTIPATIAAELGEAPFGGTHFKALFALGIVLFIITFGFNLIVNSIKARNRR